MKKLIVASLFALQLALPALAQLVAIVAAAKGAPRDTPVTLTGSIDRLPNGEYVLRDATDEIRLDMVDTLRARQELDADAKVNIVGRVDRTFAPSDEIADREPVVVKIVVEQLEVAQEAITPASNWSVRRHRSLRCCRP